MNHETVPCAHCALPSPPRGEGELAFCCTGCEAVYHAIHEAGLDHFYDLQREKNGVQPVNLETQSALESLEFLRQIEVNDDGTCEVDVYLDGVHCAGCVWLVERMPQAVDGVVDARLNLARGRLKLRWSPESVEIGTMAAWLQNFGYVPHPVDQARAGRFSEAERRMMVRVGIGWSLAANVMLLAVALYSGLDTAHETDLAAAARYASMGLTALAIYFGGREFLRRAWASIRPWNGWAHLSVDVPISIGILVGFAHSSYATVTGVGEVWFDSISVLIAALLTARWLQMRGRRHATDAAERLLSIVPSTALKLVDGEPVEVDASTLIAGDLVEIRLGDVVPIDGIISSGTSSVHRAVMTGESRPEPVTKGDEVHAGETNLSHALVVRVSAAGKETRLGKLLEWVEDAAENRAPVVQLADRLSGWFVVAVLVASVLTFVAWMVVGDATEATRHTVALLVISCPCALGMATPLALTVGMGKAARNGIFIKHDDVIESLNRVDVVVFDKTGTLTEGVMQIADIECLAAGCDEDEALRMAAVLERRSQHPIARAFSRWDDQASSVDEGTFREYPGQGVRATIDGQEIRVGRPDWLNVESAVIDRITSRGFSPVAVEVAGEVNAIVAIGDVARAEAPDVIRALEARGVRPILLSGDHLEIVRSVGSGLGIPTADCLGAQTPEQKLAFIEALRNEGKVVAMVGDGVNDAAALQAADVGVSVHGGTDLNLVAADIFMTRPGIAPILTLFEGSDQVMRVVHRNLVGSALYNVLGVTAAALGLVNPLVAAIAMPVSSLSVVVSSLIQDSYGSRKKLRPSQRVKVQKSSDMSAA